MSDSGAKGLDPSRMNCVVHLNGRLRSSKRTIGAILAARSGARLLGVHVMLDPAEALFERDDPPHAAPCDAVRSLLLDHAARLAAGTSLVLTDPLADNRAGAALFGRFRNLATRRGAFLLDIMPQENVRRLQMPSRAEHRKLTRPDVLLHMRDRYKLLRPQGGKNRDPRHHAPIRRRSCGAHLGMDRASLKPASLARRSTCCSTVPSHD